MCVLLINGLDSSNCKTNALNEQFDGPLLAV